MKRIYLLSLWLLACLVLPIKGQAVTQADLLNSERFEHIDSSADSGIRVLTLDEGMENIWTFHLLSL